MMSESQPNDEWIQPSKARLYNADALVGMITHITLEDMFNWSGMIELTPAAQRFQVMFDYFAQEEHEREPEGPEEEDLPFDEELLDNWFIEDENGRRKVSWPVICDGEVFWRD